MYLAFYINIKTKFDIQYTKHYLLTEVVINIQLGLLK